MKRAMTMLGGRLRSFGHAFRGLGSLFRTQLNARLHAAACLLVILWGSYLGLNPLEWALVLICIGGVLSAEAMNTALEFLADEVTLERRKRIRHAKDVAASAVLIACSTSLGVWGLILWRHLGCR